MKKILFAFVLMPCIAYSQNFVKQYIHGTDTVEKGTTIRLVEGKVYAAIYPSGKMQTSWRTIYTNHLQENMTGKAYKIDYLKKYSNDQVMAVIKIHDNTVNKLSDIEYVINLERAFMNNEIEVVR